jgi:proline iminopeptidase
MSGVRRWLGAAMAMSALLLVSGCQRGGLSPREGMIQVPGGRVWFKIVGTGPRTPLLVLHGGPGGASYYLKPLQALGDERPVIFYDQLGAGHSDSLRDSTQWTLERYVQEIPRVREALGLKEVHLLGHSFGTLLAVEYLATNPQGVRSVTLASPALSLPRWIADSDTLRAMLPDSIQQVIAVHESLGTTSSPEYQAAMQVYYRQFLARRTPWSADTDSLFAHLNMAIYTYMQGPSEFTITGTLKDYDGTAKLGTIKIPTLFTAGAFDEARPATVAYYQSLVPGSELAIIPDAGHLTMQDQPEAYVEAVRKFLHEVEAK